MTDDDLVKAAETILARINDDNSRHGGLITRETIRACDDARLVIRRWKEQQKGKADDSILHRSDLRGDSRDDRADEHGDVQRNGAPVDG